MASKHKRTRKYGGKKNKTMRKGKKMTHGKKMINGKKWTTALTAANKTLSKTGSIEKARVALKSQALSNARLLFGSVGERL